MKKWLKTYWMVVPSLVLFATVYIGALCHVLIGDRVEEPVAPAYIGMDVFSNAELMAQRSDDICIVALTIFAEARSESHKGRLAVASVIWNRAHGHTDMLAEVCIISKQFSCWNGKKNTDKLLATLRRAKMSKKESAILDDCMSLASSMMTGQFVSTTSATHYHSTSIKPHWAKGMRRLAMIGRHIFYRV